MAGGLLGRRGRARQGRGLKVGGNPDMRAPAGSDRKKKKRGRGRSWAAGWTLGRGVKRKGHRPARAVRAGGEEKGGGGPRGELGHPVRRRGRWSWAG
jgi:hypothetical protein